MKTSIKKMKLADLIPTENNPRQIKKDDFERLKKSVQSFPQMLDIREIVVDEDNRILGGHQRVKALLANGEKEVNVKVVEGLSEEEKREFVIRDNIQNGEWDFDVLANEWDDLPLDDWGIDLPIADIEDEIVEDEAPEPPAEPKSKLGEIYQLGEHRLMCGDATDLGMVKELMDGQKADMVFTDPPYGVDVVSDDGKVGADFGIAKKGVYSKVIADETTETAEKSYKVLKEFASKMIIWGGNYFVDFLDFSDGWLVWDKRGDTGIRNTFADGEMAWCSFHTPLRIYKQIWNGMIREGEHEKRVHPTQKPIRMLGEILKDFTKDSEIVLDVFGGSGSTLIACEQLNRICYMLELDPHYIDVIIERWENLTGKKAERIQ